jgi:diguanylate cyclase (GGDEF)-like protein/PAS domain S-box-containing protein
LAVVGAVTSVWTNSRRFLPTSPLFQSLAFGVVMGAGSVFSMMTTLEVGPGLTLDMRSALISVGGFFGGPVVAVLAAIVGIAYRLAQGGVGASAGCVAMGCAAIVGIVGGRCVAYRPTRQSDIVVLAVATALSLLPGFLFMPYAARIAAMPLILGPMAALLFASTLLAGLALLHEAQLQETMETNQKYRAIVEMLPECLNYKNSEGSFELANSATARLMRTTSAQDLIGKTDFDFYPEEIARQFREDEEAVIAGIDAKTIEQKASFPDGTVAWLSTLKMPVRDSRKKVIGLITLNRDVTDKKRLQERLQLAHEHLEDALANMADGLVLYDRQGKIQFSNLQYWQLFPITADLRVTGAALADVIRESIQRGEEQPPATDDFEAWLVQRCQGILRAGSRTIKLSNDRWIEARTKIVRDGGSLILFTDITDRKRAEDALTQANANLARLAWSDGLTGLTNRRGFDDAFQKEFGRGVRDGQYLGLLLIDVDKFKAYNDTYGHQAGDLCLQLISRQLQAVLRHPADLTARYGGEEFVALLPHTDPLATTLIADSIRREVRNLNLPHSGSNHGIVTVSIGATAHIPGYEIKQAADLLRRADSALYAAKAQGRDQVYLDMPALPSTPSVKLSFAS